MATCIRAMHRMEERYSRLILEFIDIEHKQMILKAVDDISIELKYHPTQVTINNSSPAKDMMGEIYVEFDDDYDKIGGIFHEKLLKVLDVVVCD